MSFFTIANLAYLVSAALFVFGLKRLQSPKTARSGNVMAAVGMALAIIVTLLETNFANWQPILVGAVIGALAGSISARAVQMTAMPQMVGLFNGFGGGASALVAISEFMRLLSPDLVLTADSGVSIVLGTLIGGVTFSGSMIAFGKLQGWMTGAPITWPLQKAMNAILFIATLAIGTYVIWFDPTNTTLFLVIIGLALALGITSTIPIGGADMPVVISLLNSYSGLAAAAAGFVVDNRVLIISGSLVGASGLILTNIMCVGMNRSLANVLFGAVGTADVGAGGSVGAGEHAGTVQSIDADGAAVMLAYARSVIFVPGYGMAVAQAQHAVRELADVLKDRGVDVKYAIHPVAGRMPGHMNVLLAEANVPYDELYDMDDINDSFKNTSVAVVIGANDVVNPAARHDTSSPLYGMPILNVDEAEHIIVLKRSMRAGFAGVENELFFHPKTMMLFGDAKESVSKLVMEAKAA
ncbi:MAG: NAD(P)(+) transhydrogenase (Re/Si-specific) subunit beta [Gemmatimonadetes bacterium]|uniref:NAD(P) transhydrogenase subunit beta n=1 Tax=Candidatus Kutchimonas denitrificans TaxID=3056748 RepID=A0AAE4Z9M1_9BACT|nr:NAD(P)(+) transhydrogenase (Re/Si-specific) subunit beta [Gemmatimonadota bacterium]NIR76344.1 NAD(P)(+) transhydrogenase (Re/Si-specific) subunit beta [Candidatus Kutchimonas denitrificans]NIS02367.1 NAD(P)(+) transhydrogenase (Re/Si-specific) subunit beta [Gemmatimonadota bacterium]NIT68186.1 NAD(P)(+) transhydrogenase (Re/Si-specific) subunit beta [Gemmatimonadota bacterium]NIU54410.1 NAD synthetase [Gemmatimonadota bacterium]